MKKLVLTFILGVFFMCSYGQIKRMFFVSAGMSLLADVHLSSSPVKVNENGGEVSYQHFQWNYFSFHFGGRMNIANLGDNMTLSVRTLPTLAFGSANSVFEEATWYSLGVTVPAFVELNYGVASRWSSAKDKGLVVGCGFEYSIYPIAGVNLSEEGTLEDFQKTWIQPVVEVAYRYLNNKSLVNEVNLKAGMGEEGEEFTNFANTETKRGKKSYSVRISFSRIINY